MDNNHGTNRPGTENHDILTGHVLKPSKFLSALRVLQLLLALAILGLAGFVVTFIGYSGAILDLFVVCSSFIYLFPALSSSVVKFLTNVPDTGQRNNSHNLLYSCFHPPFHGHLQLLGHRLP
ncbi:hypothetical protein BCIN_16g04610 [Botrytis cinerea B05.10]|uniref:Uncharacterized protein n=1 Tax=Botryotinia fuckeliana (strain B05.10) TaxID=332648 RepID=A0A384K7J4_BOTFB|nr:hypothetical protein BCIN_16g04610 [Botrytis cinerea B05.10]XP_024554000.1 hypothetical protein BCIN_16g04610 [Botrytis cinerea B05.10]ATZ58769.1 hypothetical protein BCIN_16g04610 [Botrytis cinerea B05.10]ATZ58771.1 hypothetical protein BCIN_16g04610 [Botrytis cinerea B05.10]